MPWLIRSHHCRADRASKRLNLNYVYSLIVSTLISTSFVNKSNAQKTNELIFEDLVMKFWLQRAQEIDSLGGFVTVRLDSNIGLLPEARYHLLIDPPSVVFRKVARHRFERKVETIVNLEDTIVQTFMLTYQDTLEGREIAHVRHSQFPELHHHHLLFSFLPANLVGL